MNIAQNENVALGAQVSQLLHWGKPHFWWKSPKKIGERQLRDGWENTWMKNGKLNEKFDETLGKFFAILIWMNDSFFFKFLPKNNFYIIFQN